MIYVTVGTLFLDFPRLINKMDTIAQTSDEPVVMQTGLSTTLPKYCEHFDFRPREEVLALQRQARVVVCHAGIGCVIDALQTQRPLIAVPRRKELKEHMNDHQFDIARAVERRGWGRMILDVAELDDACANPPSVPESYAPAKQRLIEAVRQDIARVAALRVRRRG